LGPTSTLGDRGWAAGDACGQVLALHQFHHESACEAAVLDPGDLGDVRVIERGERARLALEAHQAIGVAGAERRDDFVHAEAVLTHPRRVTVATFD